MHSSISFSFVTFSLSLLCSTIRAVPLSPREPNDHEIDSPFTPIAETTSANLASATTSASAVLSSPESPSTESPIPTLSSFYSVATSATDVSASDPLAATVTLLSTVFVTVTLSTDANSAAPTALSSSAAPTSYGVSSTLSSLFGSLSAEFTSFPTATTATDSAVPTPGSAIPSVEGLSSSLALSASGSAAVPSKCGTVSPASASPSSAVFFSSILTVPGTLPSASPSSTFISASAASSFTEAGLSSILPSASATADTPDITFGASSIVAGLVSLFGADGLETFVSSAPSLTSATLSLSATPTIFDLPFPSDSAAVAELLTATIPSYRI